MNADTAERRAEKTRTHWLETLERFREDRDAPGSSEYWSPRLDTASRDELRAIQDAKVAAVAPFLYENSAFYRRRGWSAAASSPAHIGRPRPRRADRSR